MNAYKLANYLERNGEGCNCEGISWAECICDDALWINDFVEYAADMLRQQADRIAELEKPTKQCKDCREINPAEIHTCSPQTKQLTDEQIRLIYCETEEQTSDDFEYLRFARAIIKEVTK